MVMVVAFARASSVKVEILPGYEGLHLFLLYNFYVETCFSAPLLATHTPNNLHFTTYHENNVQSPIRTCTIIILHEQLAIFATKDVALSWVISLKATNGCLSHTLTALSNPAEKFPHGTKCYWYWILHNSSKVNFVYELKSLWVTLDLTELRVNSL